MILKSTHLHQPNDRFKMSTQISIQEFLSQKKLAVVDVSHTGKKFSNIVYKELKAKGYQEFPVNPKGDNILDERCYPNLQSLPEKVDGVLVITKPVETEKVVREASSVGIQKIWIQQGAESDEAIRFCKEQNVNVIYGECILMFAEPAAFFHRLHRGVWKLIGKYPK
ncbi:MAG: CoA-binding protein [Bacteroidota bacterium]|nr:CoA-binding protein [Bacteroidota bacterium]